MTKTMSLTLLRNSAITLIAALAMFSVAIFAHAEDGTSASVDATVQVQADGGTPPADGSNTGTKPPMPPKPKPFPGRPLLNNILQTRGEIKDDRQNLKDARGDLKDARMNGSSTPEEKKDARQEVRGAARDLRQDALKVALKRTGLLMIANINRLNKLIERIESRADKLDAKGVATADARADLATAKTELASAQSDIDSLKTTAALILNSQTLAAASTSVDSVKTTLQSARTHIKNANEAVKSAVKKLIDAAKAAGLTSETEAHGDASASTPAPTPGQ